MKNFGYQPPHLLPSDDCGLQIVHLDAHDSKNHGIFFYSKLFVISFIELALHLEKPMLFYKKHVFPLQKMGVF